MTALILAVVVLMLVLPTWGGGNAQGPERGENVPYSEIADLLERGQVTEIWLDDGASILVAQTDDGTRRHANYPASAGDEILAALTDAGVKTQVVPAEEPGILPSLVLTLLPVALILGFFVFLNRRGGLSGLGALGAAKGKNTPVEIPATRFSDVAGVDEALEDLREVVDFLHHPDRYLDVGATRPRGFLLVGPPGTGKTLLARAVAGEAGVPFFAITGSDFVELFAGLGASRVRNLFAKAREQDKAIVFIDEIDAIGKARGRGLLSGANDERENTLNALLVELDGFARHDGIVILAATNRVDVLDAALLRPGRFDRTIVVTAPDRGGRQRILELYAKKRPFAPDIDWALMAKRTAGMTGAQLEQFLNEAALEAARRAQGVITGEHLEEALATSVLGRERKSAAVTERDRTIVAWHEAGHAVTSLLLKDADDPVQVSIIPRGGTGGATWMTGPENDLVTRSQARARLIVALGGRAAEELLLDGDHTQGAHGDLQQASALATEMVARYGMGRRLVSITDDRLAVDGPTGREIDDEVNDMLVEAFEHAKDLLIENRELLQTVAATLLEQESITGDELKGLARTRGRRTAAATKGRKTDPASRDTGTRRRQLERRTGRAARRDGTGNGRGRS